jgi:hypothetical protein
VLSNAQVRSGSYGHGCDFAGPGAVRPPDTKNPEKGPGHVHSPDAAAEEEPPAAELAGRDRRGGRRDRRRLVGCSALVGHALNQAANPNSAAAGRRRAHAGAASSPASSSPATLQLGESADISQNGTGAATIVISQPAISSQPAGVFSQGPQNGFFVSVHVTANATADGFGINPLDFYALSGSTHYDEGDGNAFEGPNSADELRRPRSTRASPPAAGCCSTCRRVVAIRPGRLPPRT